MSTVEIYVCREGQSLKEGKVEFSSSIYDRDDAQSDAERRCRGNTWMQKVAYYKVNEEGDFRIIYTHQNPNFVPKAVADDAAKKKPAKKKKKVKKKSFWQRLLGGNLRS